MKTTTTTSKMSFPGQDGEMVNVDVEFENGITASVSAFVGVINYPERDKYAGYSEGRHAEGYEILVWMNRFFVDDIDNRTRQEFESLTDAVEYYFALESDHKVLNQNRKLTNGKIDATVIKYRWV